MKAISKLLTSLVLAVFLINTTFAEKPIVTVITSDDDSSDTVKYDIQIDNNSDFSSPLEESISSLENPGRKTYNATLDLSPSTYYWRSKSIDSHGAQSDWSATRSFAINEADSTPPSTPTNFQIVSGDEQLTLGWVNPLDSDFAEVKIYRQQGEAENNTSSTDITETQSTTATGALVENLQNNTPYTFWLTALDTSGNESIATAKLTATPGSEEVVIALNPTPEPTPEPIAEPLLSAPIETAPEINPAKEEPIASVFFKSGEIIKNTLPTTATFFAGIGLIASVAAPVSSAAVSLILSATSALGATLPAGATVSGAGAMASGAVAIPGVASGFAGGANIIAGGLQHILFGWLPKRRKKSWGKIISKETNAEIKNAFVRLISIDLDRTVDQTYSDDTGRYGFLIKKPGAYKIGVFSNGYNPYYTQLFNIDNIDKLPYDLDVLLEYANAIEHNNLINTALIISKIGKLLDKIRVPTLLLGTILSIYNAIYINNVWSIALIIFYVLLWTAEIFLSKQPRPYGQILNTNTNKPLDRVIIRLFSLENQEQKLVFTTVTDESGKFYFLVAPGEYVITATRIGFNIYKSEKLLFKKYSNLKLDIKLQKQTTQENKDKLAVYS